MIEISGSHGDKYEDDLSSRILCHAASRNKLMTLMMEEASTSETSVNFYETTAHNIPEGNHLHTVIISLNSINRLTFVIETH
jgi:hypothetical protein